MSHDQCPSTTKGEKKQASKGELAAVGRLLSTTGAGGGSRPAWRSRDELADVPAFREFVEREFPAGASELLESDRRGFMKVMGASLALAGVAMVPGCRRPEHTILPYSRTVPEDVIPGKPLFYATAMPMPGGGCEGLLVETHEGRPTKIEGNPLHPLNRGKSSVWAQASIMSLYDPDRLKDPTFDAPGKGRTAASWDDFKIWAYDQGNIRNLDKTAGEGVAIIADKADSPSRDAAKAALLKKWPKAVWVNYNPSEHRSALEAERIAFGMGVRALYSLDKAKVILSLDRDLLNPASAVEPGGLKNAREFASTRDLRKHGDTMSRLYVAESSFTVTGGQADHRVRLAPSRIAALAVLVAQKVLATRPAPAALTAAVNSLKVDAAGVDAKFVDAVAEDLIASAGHGLVVAGPSMPAAVFMVAGVLNIALGNMGATVRYLPLSADQSADSFASLAALCEQIDAGKIHTVVCLNVNPVFNAPGTLNFASRFRKVKTTITLSVESSETAAASTWSLPGAHFLESWGDVRSIDGTVSAVQPMIEPLYGAAKGLKPMSEIELLDFLAGNEEPSGYELVRAWKSVVGGDFERGWRRALHDGVVAGTARSDFVGPEKVNQDAVVRTISALTIAAAPSQSALEAVILPGHLHDGRYANIGWLQELPQHASRCVWDNPALVSFATARALGVEQDSPTEKMPEAQVCEVSVGGKTVKIPVWATPGVADNTIILTEGYGRTVSGLVADGVGVNVSAARDDKMNAWASGVKVSKTGEEHEVASTQHHWTMDNRESIVREIDVAAWEKHAQTVKEHYDPIYGRTFGKLNLAERLGELSHTPPNIGSYAHPMAGGAEDATPGSVFSKGPQWGMSIDLSRCTGCGVCTIACQAENNIPVVGKKETQKGREMTWIRVDRYFTGDDLNEPEQMVHQPVACVHCEYAPCETVCPVNATVHGPEGLNYMVYNRCIGTRYCANNCPYKVRRFNFFDYGVTKFNGGYLGKETLETVLPERGGASGSPAHNKVNPNFIPPRLREKLPEIARMQKNPNVTVRSRGVMEKCTYCVQRINEARIECKLNDVKAGDGSAVIPDGFFQAACQQACPSEAIVFGDILDTKSKAHEARHNARSYGLLAYLNTRPRTTYMLRVRNPNPKLRTPVADPFHDHGGHDGHDHGPKAGGGHASAGLVERRSAFRGMTTLSLKVLGA